MKNTRKVITMGFAVASLVLLATAAVSAVDGPAVMVTNYTLEPKVLMPGDTGTITVTIKNMDTKSSEMETRTTKLGGDSSTTQMTSAVSAEIETIRLSSSGEIEWLQKGSYRTKYYNVGSLGQGESISISLPIKADTHASDGTYFTELYVEVDNGENVRFPIPVKVESSEVELLVKDIPSEISFTESVTMEIEVANNRPNSVNGVIVYMKPLSTGLKFTPERIFIGDLGAYGKRAVDFTLQTSSTDATSGETGTKKFAFEVTYKNGDNKHQNGLESSVFVTSIADVRLILVNAPESVFKDDVAKVEFDVANGMTKDIKAVSVMPAAIEGLRILPSEYFIGDMEVGDVFSASFDVYTRDLNRTEAKIPFKLVFRDVDTDQRQEATGYEVHIEVKEPQEAGLPDPVLIAAVLGIAVVVAILLWIVVKRKRER